MTADIIAFHIGSGLLGIVSGAAALLFRKGGGPHRAAGTVFFLAMLCMCASAAYVATMKSQTPNVLAAILTAYLVATAWMAAKRADGQTGAFEIGAMLVAVASSAGAFVVAWQVPAGANVMKTVAYAFGTVTAAAAVLDFSVIVRHGVSGAQRLARHLWRMCVAMFIASASFFVGQGAKVFPQSLRDTHVLYVPVILVVVLLLYWLIRVLLTNGYSSVPQPSSP